MRIAKIILVFLLIAVLFTLLSCEVIHTEDSTLSVYSEQDNSTVSSFSLISDFEMSNADNESEDTTEESNTFYEENSTVSEEITSESSYISAESSSNNDSSKETSFEDISTENSKEESQEVNITKVHKTNGFIVDGDRAMEPFGGSAVSGQNSAALLNEFKSKVGNDVNVYVMPIPTAVAFYAPKEYESCIDHVKDCIYGLRDALENVSFVDTYSAIYPHTNENVYSKTDHHWFALGAYYASEELAKVANVPFNTLEQFDEFSFDGFLGSAYSAYGVSELKKYPETFTWYEPKQEYVCEYYNEKFKYQSTGSMFASRNSYTKFIKGDTFVKITPEGNESRKLLVIKDSFGNALAPFLISGFKEVYMVDIRYFEVNAIKFIQENQITDVCFSLSIFTLAGSKRNNITRLTTIK